eukprot:6195066-Pleurochrysis_carterae.AAC.1
MDMQRKARLVCAQLAARPVRPEDELLPLSSVCSFRPLLFRARARARSPGRRPLPSPPPRFSWQIADAMRVAMSIGAHAHSRLQSIMYFMKFITCGLSSAEACHVNLYLCIAQCHAAKILARSKSQFGERRACGESQISQMIHIS